MDGSAEVLLGFLVLHPRDFHVFDCWPACPDTSLPAPLPSWGAVYWFSLVLAQQDVVSGTLRPSSAPDKSWCCLTSHAEPGSGDKESKGPSFWDHPNCSSLKKLITDIKKSYTLFFQVQV